MVNKKKTEILSILHALMQILVEDTEAELISSNHKCEIDQDVNNQMTRHYHLSFVLTSDGLAPNEEVDLGGEEPGPNLIEGPGSETIN